MSKDDDDDERKLPSSIGIQIEAKYGTAPRVSFYGSCILDGVTGICAGEAGGTFQAETKCQPRAKVETWSNNGCTREETPGPYSHEVRRRYPRQSTTSQEPKSRRAAHGFSPGKSTMTEKQILRLNQHRAKQRDWPSAGDLAVQQPASRAPACNFGRTTTSRPFFGPLPNSVEHAVHEKLQRAKQAGDDDDLPRFRHADSQVSHS